MKAMIIVLISLMMSITAFAAERNGFTDPTKILQVSSASQDIALKIRSNPTTGYSWFLVDYDHDLLTPVSQTYVPPTSDLVGASGYEVWHFKANTKAFTVPQLTQITLQQIRPWSAPTDSRKLTFTVAIQKNNKKPE